MNELDFQVENQPRAAYIGRTALVPIYQYPSQKMSELKNFCRGGGNLDNVQDTLTRTMSELEKFAKQGVSQTMSKLNIFF